MGGIYNLEINQMQTESGRLFFDLIRRKTTALMSEEIKSKDWHISNIIKYSRCRLKYEIMRIFFYIVLDNSEDCL